MEKLISDIRPHPKNIEIYGTENVNDLIEKIKESKWIKPITITQNNTIISGHRRYQACKEIGIQHIPVEIRTFKNETDEIEALLLENVTREKTIEQKVREGKTWEIVESEKANLRMLEGKNQYTEISPPENFPEAKKEDTGDSRDIVAKRVGFGSGRTYEKAKRVVEEIDKKKKEGKIEEAKVIGKILEKSTDGALKAIVNDTVSKFTEKDIEDIDNGIKSPNEISKEKIKIEKEIAKHEEKLQSQLIPTKELPVDKYEVILADPPWRYDFSSTESREIENKYPTMTIEDICKLKVPSADNSILFLWATAPKLLEAIQVIKAWGFEYKTNAIWNKEKIGMGYYFRGMHELLLIATKGNIGTPLPENRPASIITEARTEHSVKPDIVYDIIERMYPNKKYLEMFARRERINWKSWGNEV